MRTVAKQMRKGGRGSLPKSQGTRMYLPNGCARCSASEILLSLFFSSHLVVLFCPLQFFLFHKRLCDPLFFSFLSPALFASSLASRLFFKSVKSDFVKLVLFQECVKYKLQDTISQKFCWGQQNTIVRFIVFSHNSSQRNAASYTWSAWNRIFSMIQTLWSVVSSLAIILLCRGTKSISNAANDVSKCFFFQPDVTVQILPNFSPNFINQLQCD